MIDNGRIGRRLKARRQQLALTLKAMEARAGVSATHISEIERGKTSPTVGALGKIAAALDKDITYFLEQDPLDDVCHLRHAERSKQDLPWAPGRYAALTRRVPGARLSAFALELEPGGPLSPASCLDGNEVFLVRQGRVRFEVDGAEYELAEGDSIHLDTGVTFRYGVVGDETAKIYCFSSTRRSLDAGRSQS
jgi:transcriptional regulator with XRE-family HTH domain